MEFQYWFSIQRNLYPELTPELGKRFFEDDRLINSIGWLEQLGLSDDEICDLPLGTLLFIGVPQRIEKVKVNVDRLLEYFTRTDVCLLLVDYPVAFAEEPQDFVGAVLDIMVFVGNGWPTAIMRQYQQGDREHSIFREMLGRTFYPESWFAALEQLRDFNQPIEAE